MLLIALVTAASVNLGAGSAPLCSIARTTLMTRLDPISFAVLRATGDSVSDGNYYHLSPDRSGRTPLSAGQRPTVVYGQVFEVVAAEGAQEQALLAAGRVVLVWWRRGMSCEKFFPASAIFIPAGEALVLRESRPPAEWAGGLPTFDMMDMTDDLYPSRREIVHGVRDSLPRMSILEFIDLYRQLPTPADHAANWRTAGDRLLRWGAADTLRWRKSPARELLCQAFITQTQDPRVPCPFSARP
jgi:hypothetical protein